MAEAITVSAKVGNQNISFDTGRLAKQADGSVVVRSGDSMVLVTAVSQREPKLGFDFFPLTVDYQERLSAAGRIPGSFFRREGRLTEATGPEGGRLLDALRAHGDAGVNLAELGVGTNDRATLTGNVLEDEKILGTVHVAFGASAGIGGTVAVPIHLDVVVLDATLTVDGQPILEAGRLVVEA